MARLEICYTDTRGQRICTQAAAMMIQEQDTTKAPGREKKQEVFLQIVSELAKAVGRKGEDEMASEPTEIQITYLA